MTDQERRSAERERAIVTVDAIFAELRQIDMQVRSVKQTLEETVKPKLLQLEDQQAEHADTLLALNIKFYGILGGLALAGVTVVAQVIGLL